MGRIGTLGIRLLVYALAACVPLALATSVGVPASSAGTHQQVIGVNDVKPNACDAITLSSIVEGSGTVSGGAGAELVLGGPAVDSISGAGGDDCIVGGSGDDTIDGGTGNDICIGGPGTDSFTACETTYQE